MRRFLIVLSVCAMIFNINYLYACAVAFNSNGKSSVVSYNMDWFWLGGGLFTRASNLEHKSLSWTGAKWKSKYKSVVLSTLTDDQPFSGVNEKGLTVHCLGTPFEIVDKRKGLPALNELEAINYILDTSATVKEAKEQLAKVKISPLAFPLHYFICDKKECIAVDFKGTMKIRTLKKKEMILTNSYYDEALEQAKIGISKDGDPRFRDIMSNLYESPDNVREAIREVEQNSIIATMWNSTIRTQPDGSSELVISMLPGDEKKAIEVTFDLNEIFEKDFTKTPKWISFDNILKKKLTWNVITEAESKKVIKSNIKEIFEYQQYVLSRNQEPEKAAENVKVLQDILIDKHTNGGINCKEIMKNFIVL